jgi:hypothetical protein
LFSLGRFYKITEVCGANSWAFLSGTSYILILTENGLGYTLDDFISNSSGHPALNCKRSMKDWLHVGSVAKLEWEFCIFFKNSRQHLGF